MSASSAMPDLRIEGLTKRYGNITILDNLNLDISFSERLVVLGPSGSGKSTLLRCLMGLETVSDGRILFRGQTYIEKRGNQTFIDRKLQRKVGMVFQHYTLFPHLTVLGNLTLAPVRVRGEPFEQSERRARELLARLGLESKGDSYPARLSGGQKQRVAMARALLLEPALMLFDEVTSALDPELVAEVLSVMLDLAKRDMGMIIITHELTFARSIASRVIFIDKGQIVEDAATESFFDAPKEPRTINFLGHFLASGLRRPDAGNNCL